MTSYQSPLLKDRVPYNWEELSHAAQEYKNGRTEEQAEEGLIKLAPLPQHALNQRSQEIAETRPDAQAQSQLEKAGTQGHSFEEELIAKIVPKVVERLNSQIEIIVDVTLKTAGTRIRADLQKAVENTVRMTVREELKK